MIRIQLICVGRIKEKYYTQAAEEYAKRLSRYCDLQVSVLPDEPAPESASDAEQDAIKQKEGERILRTVKNGSYVIALAIEGQKSDSEQFAALLENLPVRGISHITFVIGGSLGLSADVLRHADMKLSFSDFTFPHQLMRVILLEQIYRAFRISHHEPYHK